MIASSEIALYCHYPWCLNKCPYCDFNSFHKKANCHDSEYILALCQDLIHSASWAQKRTVTSIFFGGGTPSLLSANLVAKVIHVIHNHYQVGTDCEITLEMNPASLQAQHLKNLKQIGINRLSIGAQSFSSRHLRLLGRAHNPEAIFRTYEAAIQAGFENINLDLMYHLPDQNLSEALSDLNTLILLNPSHISWYELTMEPNTQFAKNPPSRACEDEAFKMTKDGLEILAKHGYRRYEVSAFTRDKTCRHNLQYWQFGDYIGCGNGAHSKMSHQGKQYRWQRKKAPTFYVAQPLVEHQKRILDDEEILFEYMLNHLRLVKPISRQHFEKTTGLHWQDVKSMVYKSHLTEYFKLSEQMLCLTEHGRWFLNDCVSVFLNKIT